MSVLLFGSRMYVWKWLVSNVGVQGGVAVKALASHQYGPGSIPTLDWVVGSLFRSAEVSSRVLRFPRLLENQHLIWFALICWFQF